MSEGSRATHQENAAGRTLAAEAVARQRAAAARAKVFMMLRGRGAAASASAFASSGLKFGDTKSSQIIYVGTLQYWIPLDSDDINWLSEQRRCQKRMHSINGDVSNWGT